MSDASAPKVRFHGEMFFGKDQLRDVEEEILAQQSAAKTNSSAVARPDSLASSPGGTENGRTGSLSREGAP